MTTAKEAQQAELVAAEGAAAALMRAMRPDGDAAGVAKDLVNLLGRNPALKSQMARRAQGEHVGGGGGGDGHGVSVRVDSPLRAVI